MRKIFLVLILICTLSSVYAQQRPWRIGIKGGVNFIHLENYGGGYYSDFDPKPGYSVGVLFQYTWGGFLNYSLVPEIQYTESRTDVDLLYITDCLTTMQSLDIPVNFKLGLKLSKIFRPYIMCNVYGSYIVKCNGDFWELLDIKQPGSDVEINKWYFGLGAGMGFDLWKFQVEGRYRWNMNRIKVEDYSALKQMGLELTCAFLF